MKGWENASNQAVLEELFVNTPPAPPPVASASSVPTSPPPVSSSGNNQSEQNKDSSKAINTTVVNDVLDKPDFISSSEQIRGAINDYATNKSIVFGQEDDKGRIFYKSTQTVGNDATNPQFVKWRVTAYKKAMVKIRQEFLEQTYGKIQGEIIAEYFSDDSDNKEQFIDYSDTRSTSKEGEIYDKLLGLTGAKLDEALSKMGIDPTEYNKAPPEQRKNIFKDSIVDSSIKRSTGSLTGLMPIKTFVGIDSKGNYTVGVIAMYYGKLKQLADDIVKKRAPMLVKKSGTPIQQLIPQNKKVLADSFGVRLAFNQFGEPVLISYGQWGSSYNGKKQRKIDRAYDFAYKKAKTESQKQIAIFLKANATFSEIANTSASVIEDVVKGRDDNISRSEVSAIIDTLEQSTKVTYKADLRGVKEYKAWSYKLETGQQVVGVVSIWSQKNAEGVDNIRNWKSNYKNPAMPIQKTIKPSVKSGVGQGAGMDADF
jgi:hypothetical protein